MFGSSRKLSRITQPGPRTTSCRCSIHQHTSLAAFSVSGVLDCVPAAKFMVDQASRKSSNTNLDGLYNFSLVRS